MENSNQKKVEKMSQNFKKATSGSLQSRTSFHSRLDKQFLKLIKFSSQKDT